MGILNWIGIGKEISEPINAVGNLYTTEKEKLMAEQKIQETLQQPQLAQLDTNKILANSTVFFNAGWQPMLGWSCGFLVLLYYAPQIVIATFIWGINCYEKGIVSPFPIAPDNLMNIIYLLFGFGVHSIFSKIKN